MFVVTWRGEIKLKSELLSHDIPSNWIICNFGDIFNILGGNQPPKSEFSNLPQPGYIRLLQIRDFASDKCPVYIKDSPKWRKCFDDDLLIARYGASLGRICTGKSGAYNVALVKVLFEKQFLDSSWVKCFLESEWFQAPLFLVSRSAQSGFNKKELFIRSVPLPPLNEQKRIVAKIEALQTRSSAVKEELEAIKPLLDQFRQSVLAAAFRGDLTKDWREQNPDVEPAEVLLERIRVERRRRWEEAELEKMKTKGKVPKDDKWKKKYKEPEPIDTEGLPELPDGWCWVRAEQICDFITKGTTPSKQEMFEGYGEVPYVKVYNLTTTGILDFTVNPTFINTETHIGKLARSRLFPGDILMNIVGPPLGKVSILPNTYPEWNMNQAIAVYRTIQGINNVFLCNCLLSSETLSFAINMAKATAGQFNLTLEICRNLPVPVAPVEEQQEIVRRIESLFKLADSIEQQYQQAEVDLETLNQSILAKAFRGELVPQDPNDEPASVLLERIRAEREKAKPKKSKSKKKSSSKKQDKQLGIPGM